MIESLVHMLYMPPPSPDKWLDTGVVHLGFDVKQEVQSIKNSIYFTWVVPTLFLTIDPKLSLIWLNLNEDPVNIEWTLIYRYYNRESYLGYFNDYGIPIINHDNGNSETYTVTLKPETVAEKEIVQKTDPYSFIKKDRRAGTLVLMEIQANPPLEEVYCMGSEICYTKDELPRDPPGRKRPYKHTYDEDDHYASYDEDNYYD